MKLDVSLTMMIVVLLAVDVYLEWKMLQAMKGG